MKIRGCWLLFAPWSDKQLQLALSDGDDHGGGGGGNDVHATDKKKCNTTKVQWKV